MSKNINKHTIGAALRSINKLAAESWEFDASKAYQKKYQEIVEDYRNSKLDLYSTIQLENFQPFQEWLPYLIDHKDKVIPILISKMLKQDIYALNIYNVIQNSTNSSSLTLNAAQIYNDSNNLPIFRELGASEQAIAILSAVNWLSSEQAAIEVQNSTTAQHDLCVANGG